MNNIRLLTREKITRKVFDSRVTTAKAKKKRLQRLEYNYNFCQICGINDRNDIIDPSHDISVDRCIKKGYPELAYDLDNITMRCRTKCHRKHDGLDLKFTKTK